LMCSALGCLLLQHSTISKCFSWQPLVCMCDPWFGLWQLETASLFAADGLLVCC
jgi:hypothetical protein